MKFGKITDKNLLTAIDFSLSSDNFLFRKDSANKNFEIFVAAPAWRIKGWVGKIYPEKSKSKDFLREYSKNFNSIELNTTHYRVPKPETIMQWRSEVGSGFKFCPKVTQSISHYGGLTNVNKIKEFVDAVNLFEKDLGICFMQLSENFAPKRINDLKFFINNFPKDIKLNIEFRHPEWFQGSNEIWQFLAMNNIGSVISDVGGKREVLHSNITTDFMVVRFVGNDLHESDFTRIDLWIEKLSNWKEQGVKQIYFFVHEPDDINCPEIADYFVEKVNERFGMELPRMNFQKKSGDEVISLFG